jgi:hypothetical protein
MFGMAPLMFETAAEMKCFVEDILRKLRELNSTLKYDKINMLLDEFDSKKPTSAIAYK